MPARDGTGPLGQGEQTGRGLGNCRPGVAGRGQTPGSGLRQPGQLGRGFWKTTFGRIFGRRNANRINRK